MEHCSLDLSYGQVAKHRQQARKSVQAAAMTSLYLLWSANLRDADATEVVADPLLCWFWGATEL